MSVIVTGASGPIGRAAISPLLAGNPEVRAAVRRPDDAEALRSLGAKVTVDRLDDAQALAEVCQGMFTLIHLVGGVNQPTDDEMLAANHGSVLTAISAAKEAKVRRFVLVSYPGARPDAAHPFLRAKGLAEEAVSNSGLQFAIVRCTHAYGVGGLWFTATVEAAGQGAMIGDGLNSVAPILADDIGSVLAAIDDDPAELTGIWGLEGPDAFTGERLFTALTGGAPTEGLTPHAAAMRLSGSLRTTVSVDTCRLFAGDSRADGPDAAERFGVVRTGFSEGLARTVATLGLESLEG